MALKTKKESRDKTKNGRRFKQLELGERDDDECVGASGMGVFA
jgi:hypothetical protein